MEDKRKETLVEIEKVIHQWKNKELSEETALDDIHDLMSELSVWEESEYRRRSREEFKRNSITIQSKVQYMGELKLPPIDFCDDNKDDE